VGLVIPPQYSEMPPFRYDRYDLVLFGGPHLHLYGFLQLNQV